MSTPPTLTVPDMAWMAGVIDMKGRTRRVTSPSRATPLCVLQVESQHLPVLRRLAKLTGTRLEVSPAKELPVSLRRQCSEHCPDAHQHVHPVMPEIGRWHVSGAGAAIVLVNLMPYFGTDNTARVDFVSQVINQIPARGRGRHAVNLTIARLGRLGWDVPPKLVAA